MARRNTEMFNLSFLDLLSGALGAVIFLFIITPKGGDPAAKTQQVMVAIDTLHRQVFGELHDSLATKGIGDTLLVLIGDFKKMPSIEDCPACPPRVECPPARPCPTCPKCPSVKSDSPVADVGSNPVETVKAQPTSAPAPPPSPPKGEYEGDPPGVPCNVSFELNWRDAGDNVDLIVCKENDCVSGRKKKQKAVGQWSSGITPTNIFGTDFRTSQESVRQFRELIPGRYSLKARFKESEKGNRQVDITGLIYTKNLEGKERGKRFNTTLQLDPAKETPIGTVELKENGEFNFIKN